MEEQQSEFEELVKAYSADLYRYAYWLCKNQSLAEDLVQECFMRAWKALHSLQDAGAARAWLITILRREFARYYAKKDNQNLALEEVSEEAILPAGLIQNEGESVIVYRALAALPLKYREPLVLQVLGGYSCNEIAEILEVKSGAVMTRIFRARQKLRQQLTEPNDSDKPAKLL